MEWRKIFWITFGVIVLTNIIYNFFGSGEIQPWNDTIVATEEETIKWGTTAGAKKKKKKFLVLINFFVFLSVGLDSENVFYYLIIEIRSLYFLN